MYEIIKSFNETTKLAMKDNMVFVVKKILFEDTELYRSLSTIKNENVARVFETVLIENDFYAVTEFVQGRTLAEYIESDGVMTDEQACETVLQICNGLEAIHSLGIIHRDINPNNIMITEHGKIKIIDFGISRFQKTNQSKDTQILGTQGFTAPEQFGFAQTSVRSDIYSLGVLMNYLKTGCLPSEKMEKGSLSSIIIKCTQMDEKNRYNNISDLMSDITKKNKFMRVIRTIPGFRKNVLWHKIVAIVYYLFNILLLIAPSDAKEYLWENELKWDIVLILIFWLPVPILLNQWNWQDKWSFTRNKKKSSKILISVIISIIVASLSLAINYKSL